LHTDVVKEDRTAWLRPVALYIAIAGLLASIAVVRGLFDPDYFWHLATGELILDAGAIPTTDPFSFTWRGEPWVPDQWLAEVAIAAGVRAVGPAPVLVAFGMIAALGPALVAAAALHSGARTLHVVAASALITAALLPQVTIRPQVISFALAGLLLALLIRARPKSRNRLWVLPFIFLVWANAHGFFIVGLGIGLVYLVATLMGRTSMRSHRGLVLAIGLASLVATMLTPSGPGGLLYALSFGDPADSVTQQIMEWQSPDFHNAQFLPFLAVLGLLFLAGVRGRPGWVVVVALVGAALGLFAVRAIGIGSILVLPMLLLGAGASQRAVPVDDRRPVVEVAVAAVMSAVLVAVSIAGAPITVDARRAPIAAADFLRETAPDARVLAAYEWGGYLINELHRLGGTVFVDGRMHKYQPQVIADYLSIADAQPGWEALVDRYGVEALLFYPETLLVRGPAQASGWCEAYRDEVQVLLFRTCEGADG